MTGVDEQANEKEHHNKGVEEEGKAEDQTGISKVKVSNSSIPNLFCYFLKQKTKKLYFFCFHLSFPGNVVYHFDYKCWLFPSDSFSGRLSGN